LSSSGRRSRVHRAPQHLRHLQGGATTAAPDGASTSKRATGRAAAVAT